MRDDDEIPRHYYSGYTGEAPECIGTCLHRTRTELKDQSSIEICRDLKTYCESSAMRDFCALAGVHGVQFTWNPHIKLSAAGGGGGTDRNGNNKRRLSWLQQHRQSKLFDAFWKAYREEPSLNLALAFHGTAEGNVSTILRHGLDARYRRTQAFGRGEYFSKDPGLAATYRHDGQKLMVYLLLMPKDVERVFSQKDRDIVVVPKAAHQLPLGYLSFDRVNEDTIQHSQQMRLQSRQLKSKAVAIEAKIREAKKKSKAAAVGGESIEKLQWQAEEAWRDYLRMKMDAQRNHVKVQVLAEHVQNQPQDDVPGDDHSVTNTAVSSMTRSNSSCALAA